MTYFIYSSHRTREAAQAALEQYFAEGRISAGERPYIDHNMRAPAAKRYRVMFPG